MVLLYPKCQRFQLILRLYRRILVACHFHSLPFHTVRMRQAYRDLPR
jgi:hypothetical protein